MVTFTIVLCRYKSVNTKQHTSPEITQFICSCMLIKLTAITGGNPGVQTHPGTAPRPRGSTIHRELMAHPPHASQVDPKMDDDRTEADVSSCDSARLDDNVSH